MNINELVMIRKMLNLTGEYIAVEMGVTRQTVVNLELGKVKTKKTITLYELIMLKMINEYDSQKKEEIKTALINIIEHL